MTSSRSEITRSGDVHLKAGIPLTERELLEGSIEDAFEDKSALVSPIGGLSAFPAMVLETDSLVWLADTFAHEWAHHLLIFYPLGCVDLLYSLFAQNFDPDRPLRWERLNNCLGLELNKSFGQQGVIHTTSPRPRLSSLFNL